MIIFDLDGTLADCEYRRHFVDASKNPGYKRRWDCTLDEFENNKLIPIEYIRVETTTQECHDNIYKKFSPDYKSFYEACDQDKPIEPVITTINHLILRDEDIQIWSGRCESVRDKTINWLKGYLDIDAWFYRDCLKMRPIGDSTPDDQLKERWLDEYITGGGNPIEFVFDDRPKVIRMWRRRGIFVFNCCQHNEEF